MRRDHYPVTCDLCGGEGLGDIRTAAAAWDARATVFHADPRVCRANLERQLDELRRCRDPHAHIREHARAEQERARAYLRRLVADTRRDLGLAS